MNQLLDRRGASLTNQQAKATLQMQPTRPLVLMHWVHLQPDGMGGVRSGGGVR